MSAEPSELPEPPNVVEVGDEKAVVVPLIEYRVMKDLTDRASQEDREDAWMNAVIAEHEEWKAAGRPGGTIPHELWVAECEAAWAQAGSGDEG